MIKPFLNNHQDSVMPDENEVAIAREVLAYLVRSQTFFRIDSDLKQIHSLLDSIREQLQVRTPLPDGEVREVTNAVREALLNAHIHGRPTNDQQSESPLTSIIEVEVTQSIGQICFSVTDQGPGFDCSGISNAAHANVGNGFRTMLRHLDCIHFNDSGNRIILTKKLPPI